MELKLSDIQTYQYYQLLDNGAEAIEQLERWQLSKNRILKEYPKGKKELKIKLVPKTIVAVIFGLIFLASLALVILSIVGMFFPDVAGFLNEGKPDVGVMIQILVPSIILSVIFFFPFRFFKEELEFAIDDLHLLKRIKQYEAGHLLSNDDSDQQAIDHLKQLESRGREYFSKYRKSKKSADLLSAVKCGHPYAILLAVIKIIPEELRGIKTTSSRFRYRDESKRELVEGLVDYCLVLGMDWKQRGMEGKPIYWEETSELFDSVRFLRRVIHHIEWDSDEVYHKWKIVSELRSAVGFFRHYEEAYERLIYQSVIRDRNRSAQSARGTDVEWVYVPDVSDM